MRQLAGERMMEEDNQIDFKNVDTKVLDLRGKKITEKIKNKIRNMPGLINLYLQDTDINELDFLTTLVNLKELDISGTEIYDLSELGALTALEILVAHDVPVYDLSPLETLKLKTIQMERANISNVVSLGKIISLEVIDLYGNEMLADIEPLSGLKNLKELTIKGTNIQSPNQLSCLCALENLETLNVNVELDGIADSIISEISSRKSQLSRIFSNTQGKSQKEAGLSESFFEETKDKKNKIEETEERIVNSIGSEDIPNKSIWVSPLSTPSWKESALTGESIASKVSTEVSDLFGSVDAVPSEFSSVLAQLENTNPNLLGKLLIKLCPNSVEVAHNLKTSSISSHK